MENTYINKKLMEILGGYYDPAMVILKIACILLFSFLFIKIGSYVIRKVFRKRDSGVPDEKKRSTMLTLLLSILRYSVYIVAGVIILTDVFELTSVLAAAGIGGIAVGFGAQSLIKDIISGFFIVMEDQYAVGDLVTIEGLNGTVEHLELRVTKLRNFNGDLYIIPNGEIKKVINHTRGDKAVLVDVPIAYSSDMERAAEAAENVCNKVTAEFDTIVEAPRVLGITELGKESMNLRIFAKTVPNAQWDVERRIRKLIKEEFDGKGIKFFDRNRIIMDNDATGGVTHG